MDTGQQWKKRQAIIDNYNQLFQEEKALRGIQ